MDSLIYQPTDGIWQNVERPGYLGKNRDQKIADWNAEYGSANWRLAWQYGSHFLTFLGACMIYEDAYYAFMYRECEQINPDKVSALLGRASNIYDYEPADVASGFDYSCQSAAGTHIQDIAIRRALVRLGKWFEGDRLIRVRGRESNDPIGIEFSPGKIPFHMSWKTEYDPIKGSWWNADSVECWYQSNRFLQRRVR